MSKLLKPGRTNVELRPSRIRRDPPVPAEQAAKEVSWRSSEGEIKLAVIGIVMFALAINAVVLGISAITGN
ncbi:MAG: hypothetical protein ACR2JJ_09110 [Sphingomicrobium sp.]